MFKFLTIVSETNYEFCYQTLNGRLTIKPGETYVTRQYIITGRLKEMEKKGAKLLDDTYEDLYAFGELPGVDIHLYSDPDDYTTFSAHVDGSPIICLQGEIVCTGKSSPHYGMVPLFAITCGNQTYVGSDKYFFAPEGAETDPIRPYVCDGSVELIRPEWKLLGFFEEGSCEKLENAAYNENSCPSHLPNRHRLRKELRNVT